MVRKNLHRFLIGVLGSAGATLSLYGAVDSKEVVILEGPVKRLTLRNPGVNHWGLRIGKSTFGVTRRCYELVRDGAPYRSYIATPYPGPLAVEPL
jgi:hypothetical protein